MKTFFRFIVSLAMLSPTAPAWAVKTSHWVHTTQADFEKGTMTRVVATNLGDLKLSRQITPLLGEDARVSAVFALAQAPDGTIYAGTGPEGVLLAVKNDKVTTAAELGKHTTIFSLLVDSRGRLLIGTGGDTGDIFRIDSPGDKPKKIFESDDVQYIWAMVQTPDGTVYAATGPKGQLYAIDANDNHKLLFDSDENNLLSMVSDGGDLLYVGTDPDGLVYRINRKSSEVFVMYDAPQSEISALALDSHGNLFAGTSESSTTEDAMPQGEETGRPEGTSREAPIPVQPRQNPKPPDIPNPSPGEPLPIPKAQVAPMMLLLQDEPGEPGPEPVSPTTAPMGKHPARHEAAPAAPAAKEETQNSIYRIDPQGFVTEVFHESDDVLAIEVQDNALLVATGDDGNVYQVNPDAGETLVLAKVDSKDVMCLLPAKDGRMFMGLANEGEIAALSQGFATNGTFISAALDAGQISAFGKIQLHGTLPAGASLKMATRSGNVADADDPGWSKWTDDVPATEFLQITSPAARFLQYRLSFTSERGQSSPVVQDIDVAYQIPNLAPTIKSIKIDNGRKEDEPAKAVSKYTIKWDADDPNEDDLQFNLYFRDSARGPWILLKDKLIDPTYDWETRNVRDGRYEIKVEASDVAANPIGQGKTASRVSDPVLVDNTPPVIGDIKSSVAGSTATIDLRVVDRASTVAGLQYTVDSSRQWQSVLPQDNIADSPEELYQVSVKNLPAGARVTLRATDAMGNQSYESVMVTVEK